MDWFKSYNGAPSDTKFPLIAHKSGLKVHEVSLCWWVLMDHASQSKERGDVSGFDCEASDFFFQFKDGTFAIALNAFYEKGMIVDGFVKNWAERQKNEAAARQKKYRENQKKKDIPLQTERNGDVTLRNEHNALPEERDKREEKDKKDKKEERKIALVDTAFDLFKTFAQENDLSVPAKLTSARKSKLQARLNDCGGIEGWTYAIGKLKASSFCMGLKTDFKASLDFMLQESSFTKLMEGNYDDKDKPQPPNSTQAAMEAYKVNLAKRQGGQD